MKYVLLTTNLKKGLNKQNLWKWLLKEFVKAKWWLYVILIIFMDIISQDLKRIVANWNRKPVITFRR